jgi:HEAT repeat protein
VEPLSIALKDSHPDVREAAVEALGELGDPSATPALRGALKDTSTKVREAAEQTLKDLENPRNEDEDDDDDR